MCVCVCFDIKCLNFDIETVFYHLMLMFSYVFYAFLKAHVFYVGFAFECSFCFRMFVMFLNVCYVFECLFCFQISTSVTES